MFQFLISFIVHICYHQLSRRFQHLQSRLAIFYYVLPFLPEARNTSWISAQWAAIDFLLVLPDTCVKLVIIGKGMSDLVSEHHKYRFSTVYTKQNTTPIKFFKTSRCFWWKNIGNSSDALEETIALFFQNFSQSVEAQSACLKRMFSDWVNRKVKQLGCWHTAIPVSWALLVLSILLFLGWFWTF